MPQTTIQKLESIRFGSGILEVGTTFLSLVNIGAIREAVLNFKSETVNIDFDNTESIKKVKNGKKVSLTFNLAENDFETLAKLESGYLAVSTTLAALVPAAVQIVTNGSWLEKVFIEIANQNGNSLIVTVNSVTGSVDGLLVNGDDYDVVMNNLGQSGIVLHLSGAALTTVAQNLTINYAYTPAASKKLVLTDSAIKTPMAVRFTNTNALGKAFIVKITGASNITSLTMPFLADEADDVMTTSFEMEGILMDMVDEQSVA